MVSMYPVAGKQKAIAICRAFADGAPQGAACSVFYGVNSSNYREWMRARAHPREPWFYIDNSYFDVMRGQQYRVTMNAVQIDPAGRTSDGARFGALGLTIEPWRETMRGWLVVEQSPSFMQWVAQDPRWIEQRVQGGIFVGAKEVCVRPWSPDKPAQAASLQADLAKYDRMLTHSSAAIVEAAMRGVAGYVSRMSALGNMVCGTGEAAHLDERRQYLSVLADNQWSLDEIRAGKAWQWLAKN